MIYLSSARIIFILIDLYIGLQDLFNRTSGHFQRKQYLNYLQYLFVIIPMEMHPKLTSMKKVARVG